MRTPSLVSQNLAFFIKTDKVSTEPDRYSIIDFARRTKNLLYQNANILSSKQETKETMENVKEDETLETTDANVNSRQRQQSAGRSHDLFAPPRGRHEPGEMMGPILRRKKVVSLPLGGGGTNE